MFQIDLISAALVRFLLVKLFQFWFNFSWHKHTLTSIFKLLLSAACLKLPGRLTAPSTLGQNMLSSGKICQVNFPIRICVERQYKVQSQVDSSSSCCCRLLRCCDDWLSVPLCCFLAALVEKMTLLAEIMETSIWYAAYGCLDSFILQVLDLLFLLQNLKNINLKNIRVVPEMIRFMSAHSTSRCCCRYCQVQVFPQCKVGHTSRK